MKVQSDWYSEREYCVVKSLRNGSHQQLYMAAIAYGGGRWNIEMGIFPSSLSHFCIQFSPVWKTCTSTNKNPSIKTLKIALKALSEIETALHDAANGKKWYIYVDGMDERRLRVYTKVLTKLGYKKSSTISDNSNLPRLYKRV